MDPFYSQSNNENISAPNSNLYNLSILPTTDNLIHIEEPNEESIELTFIASGQKINLSVPGNYTIEEMVKSFMDKIGLPYNHLENDIIFNYNGEKVDPISQEKINTKFSFT